MEITKDDQLTVGLLELDKWVYQVNSPKMDEQVKISGFFYLFEDSVLFFVCLFGAFLHDFVCWNLNDDGEHDDDFALKQSLQFPLSAIIPGSSSHCATGAQ